MSRAMTAPDHSIPEGGYTVSTISELQALDEAKVKAKMLQPASTALDTIRESLITNVIGGLGKAIFDGVNGAINTVGSWFQPVHDAASQIHDGQLELNNRQDLVDNLLNTGRTYCSATQNYTGGVWGKDALQYSARSFARV